MNFYLQLEEKREANPDMPLSKIAENSLNNGSSKSNGNDSGVGFDMSSSPQINNAIDRKFSLPAGLNESSGSNAMRNQLIAEEEDRDNAIAGIQAALQAHQTRSKSLSALRSGSGGLRIHIARPWLKKKSGGDSSTISLEESTSEEETERACKSIQAVLKAHEKRRLALQRLEDDKGLFTQGKVNALKDKFNARRNRGGSDGVTDDDEDVLY